MNKMDMWREVLVRLPGECLLRNRCVCKGFRAVIDDPGFVRSHTKNWSSSSSSRVVFRNYGRSGPSSSGTCYSLDLEGQLGRSNGHHAVAATPLGLDFLSNSPGARLPWPVAACNGLVLTQNLPSSLFTIWNPLTRERLELPPAGSYAPAFGLGYDDATDDYKAVVVLRDRQTHVYSLRSDAWRRIADCPCGPDDGPAVYAGGLLHWSSSSSGDNDDKIVALELGTEKYILLQMPPPETTRMPNNNIHKHKWLNVLGGCLVVCDTASYAYLDVWVLKKKEDSSWIKLFSVDSAHDNGTKLDWYVYLRPVAFVNKDERILVFLQDSDKRFFVFDGETLKCVGIHEQRKGRVNWDAQQMFVGTLFRLRANCGVARAVGCTDDDSTNKKRKITSCCTDTINEKKKKRRRKTSCCNEKKRRKTSCCTKKKKPAAAELVFCVRDANGKNFGVCSETENGQYDISRYGQRLLKETKGFDHPNPGANWGTLVPANYRDGEPVRFAQLALDKYNQRNKKAFVFDRVVHASFSLVSCFRRYLITFLIKNNGENGPDIFHADVCFRGLRRGLKVILVRPRRS